MPDAPELLLTHQNENRTPTHVGLSPIGHRMLDLFKRLETDEEGTVGGEITKELEAFLEENNNNIKETLVHLGIHSQTTINDLEQDWNQDIRENKHTDFYDKLHQALLHPN